jgi:hypothetical protein
MLGSFQGDQLLRSEFRDPMRPTTPHPNTILNGVRPSLVVSMSMDSNTDAERDNEDLVEYVNFLQSNRNRWFEVGWPPLITNWFKNMFGKFSGSLGKLGTSLDFSKLQGIHYSNSSSDTMRPVPKEPIIYDQSGAKHDPEPEKEYCPICLIDYEYEVKLRQLPCEHRYHPEFIDLMFSNKGNYPYCKQSVIFDLARVSMTYHPENCR